MAMNEHTTLLTTVNAPYAEYMDAPTLAACLNSGVITSGQVNSFLTEVAIDKQHSFADSFDVTTEQLIATAQAFVDWSGQGVALLA